MPAQLDGANVLHDPGQADLFSIPAGELVCRRFGDASSLSAYIYRPANLPKNTPLFVSVHGISRNAEEHARMFAPYAERYGMLLLAPYFSEHDYPRYQRLGGRRGDLRRADLALLTLLDALSEHTGISAERFHLFGFSGGGQFAHRFAMAHPHRIISYVVAAAGWYTLPDTDRKFPRGIGPNRYFADLSFDVAAFLKVPATVIVGERDNKPDKALNQNPRIVAEQGHHRLERGEYWVQAMQQSARAQGIEPQYQFVIAPRCGHSFRRAMRRGRMGDVVFKRFMYGQ